MRARKWGPNGIIWVTVIWCNICDGITGWNTWYQRIWYWVRPGGGTEWEDREKVQFKCIGCVCSLKMQSHVNWIFQHCWVKLFWEPLSCWEMRYFLQPISPPMSFTESRTDIQTAAEQPPEKDLLESLDLGDRTSEEGSQQWLDCGLHWRGSDFFQVVSQWSLHCAMGHKTLWVLGQAEELRAS